MDKILKNKIVVVTGGAEGIGYEIIDKYLKEGAKTVILLDANKIKGEEAASNLSTKHGIGKVVFIKCDVTKDLEEISTKILAEYKQVDVLINNAGTVDESSVRRTMELNAIAVMEWTMKFWEHMRKDKGGRGGTIINMGSLYSFVVDPFMVYYKASKNAIMGFTRGLGHADNYNKFGVRVVIMCPGFTSTALTNRQLCWDEHVADQNKLMATLQWQKPEDVAKSAVEVFKVAESGSAWKVVGGILSEVRLVPEGEFLR